jgi:hypothetical protein
VAVAHVVGAAGALQLTRRVPVPGVARAQPSAEGPVVALAMGRAHVPVVSGALLSAGHAVEVGVARAVLRGRGRAGTVAVARVAGGTRAALLARGTAPADVASALTVAQPPIGTSPVSVADLAVSERSRALLTTILTPEVCGACAQP